MARSELFILCKSPQYTMHLIIYSGLGFSSRRSQHIGLLGRISACVGGGEICLLLSWLLDGDEDPMLLPPASHTALLVCNEMGSPSQLSPRQPGLGTGRGQRMGVCMCVCLYDSVCICVNVHLCWEWQGVCEDVREFDIHGRMGDYDTRLLLSGEKDKRPWHWEIGQGFCYVLASSLFFFNDKTNIKQKYKPLNTCFLPTRTRTGWSFKVYFPECRENR